MTTLGRCIQIFGSCCAVVLAGAQATAETYNVRGHQIEVTLALEQPTFLLGEPARLDYVVHNQSQETLYVLYDATYWHYTPPPEGFTINVTAENGKSLPPAKEEFPNNRTSTIQEIPAGDACHFKFLLPDWVQLDAPGEYTVQADRILSFFLGKDGSLFTKGKGSYSDADWLHHLDVPTRASAPLRVLPADPVALGRIIAALGDTMLGRDRDKALSAALVLYRVRDLRVIPYFSRAVWSLNLDLSRNAIAALGGYDDAAAFATLKKALTARKEDFPEPSPSNGMASNLEQIQLAVCYALENSPHPPALTYLVSQRNHLFDELRPMIVDVAGNKLGKAEAIPILREMVGDKDKKVRDRAAWWLQRLGSAKESTPEQP